MQALGTRSTQPCRVYFVGGTTAVIMGWRDTTVDVDLLIEPESDEILRAIPALKEELHINLEFATPLDFIPVAPDWRERSPFIASHGQVSYYHFDLYAQALAKLERGHAQDLADLEAMVLAGIIEPREAIAYFQSIEGRLYKYPAIDPATFRQSVLAFFEEPG